MNDFDYFDYWEELVLHEHKRFRKTAKKIKRLQHCGSGQGHRPTQKHDLPNHAGGGQKPIVLHGTNITRVFLEEP